MLNSAVLSAEQLFNGQTRIPGTNCFPNLTGWSLDTQNIINDHSKLIDRVAEYITEKYQISNGIKISAQLVSTAIIWHHKNKWSTTTSIADNLQQITKSGIK